MSTPRTDAAIVKRPDTYIDEFVTADFARGLEREINELLRKGDALRPLYDGLCSLAVSHPHLVRGENLDALKAAIEA